MKALPVPVWRASVLVISCVLLMLLGVMVFAETASAPTHPLRSAIAAAAVLPPAVAARPVARTGMAAAAVAAAEAATHRGTRLGVVVFDRVDDELAVGRLGAEPFYTASLSKLVVAVDVLDRRRLDGLVVTATDLTSLRRALGPSDDQAMNALWSRFDGAGAAARVTKRVGLQRTSTPRDPSQWGEMLTSAADMVRLWNYVLAAMPEADSEFLFSAMAAAPARGADGFDQAYGLEATPATAEAPVVTKQGWMCCFTSEFYLHSTGVVGEDQRFVVALMSRIQRGPGWEAARQELNGVARAAVAALQQ